MLHHPRKAVTSPVNKRWTKLSPQAPVSLFVRSRPQATRRSSSPLRNYEGSTINPVSLMLEMGRCWDEETFVAGFLSALYRLLPTVLMMLCFFLVTLVLKTAGVHVSSGS